MAAVGSFRPGSYYENSPGLEYDSGRFTILDAGEVSAEIVRSLDASGDLVWIGPETRVWFYSNFPPTRLCAVCGGSYDARYDGCPQCAAGVKPITTTKPSGSLSGWQVAGLILICLALASALYTLSQNPNDPNAAAGFVLNILTDPLAWVGVLFLFIRRRDPARATKPTPAPKACPHCGKRNPLGRRECVHCGRPLWVS